MSNSELTPQMESSAANEPRLIQQRFALRRLIAETALADIYWANDLHGISHSTPEAIVLLLLVKPALSSTAGFHNTWQQLLARPAPPAEAYPTISAYGEDQGVYWLAYANITGSLLSETLQALDERGMPLEQALTTAEAIALASSSVQAGAFGYLEAGAIQHTGQHCIILNAPLVKILHQLLSQNAGKRQPLALHSASISPSAAVGEIPLTEDDTFSVACLLYHLLNANAPYGQSTLTAAARGDLPASTRKLNKQGKEILRNALALQRNQRPENPDQLIQAIRKQHKRKLFFPLALLAAAGIATYASYHLLSKVETLFDTIAPATQTQENASSAQATSIVTPESAAQTQTPDQEPVAATQPAPDAPPDTTVELVNEPAAEEPDTPAPAEIVTEADSPIEEPSATSAQPVATDAPVETTEVTIAEPEPESATAETPPEEPPAATETAVAEDTGNTEEPAVDAVTEAADSTQEIQRLTQQARASLTTDTAASLSLLREAWLLDKQNATTKDLLNQLLKRRQQQAENQIQANRVDDAKQTLADNDQLIREFILTDRIQDQVRLESLAEIRVREQEQAAELLDQARLALQRGHLSSEDGNDDNALSHLNKLMFMLPGNQDGQRLIAQVVSTRQKDIQQALERGELEQAGTYLGETERLIRKYKLNNLQAAQAKLDADYLQATTAPATVETITPEQPASEQPPAATVLLPPADGTPVPTEGVEILDMPVEASTEPVLVPPEPAPMPVPEVVPTPVLAAPAVTSPSPILAPTPAPAATAAPQQQEQTARPVLPTPTQAPAPAPAPAPQTTEVIDLPPVPFDDELPANAARIPVVPALTPTTPETPTSAPQATEVIDLPPVPFDDELPVIAPVPFDDNGNGNNPESANATEPAAAPLQELFEIPVSVINDGLQGNDRK